MNGPCSQRSRSEGFTLIELLIVIVIIGILTAIAIPMYLNQREKAKEAGVKGGVHAIEVGIASYGVDHGDTYPDAVTAPDGASPLVDPDGEPYIDNWPDNPWTGDPMDHVDDVVLGDYTYVQAGDPLGTDFTLVGYLKDGEVFLVR